jgi:hypothetical protein
VSGDSFTRFLLRSCAFPLRLSLLLTQQIKLSHRECREISCTIEKGPLFGYISGNTKYVFRKKIYSNIYPTRCNVTHFIYIWKLLYMFRVVSPPIIRSAYNYVFSIWYLSHRYCYLPLSKKSWNRSECAVGGVRYNNLRHTQHTQTGSNSSTIAADSSNDVTNARCCRYSCMRS